MSKSIVTFKDFEEYFSLTVTDLAMNVKNSVFKSKSE